MSTAYVDTSVLTAIAFDEPGTAARATEEVEGITYRQWLDF